MRHKGITTTQKIPKEIVDYYDKMLLGSWKDEKEQEMASIRIYLNYLKHRKPLHIPDDHTGE